MENFTVCANVCNRFDAINRMSAIDLENKLTRNRKNIYVY